MINSKDTKFKQESCLNQSNQEIKRWQELLDSKGVNKSQDNSLIFVRERKRNEDISIQQEIPWIFCFTKNRNLTCGIKTSGRGRNLEREKTTHRE